MGEILGLIYVIAGFWAVGVCLYEGKVVFYTSYYYFFMKKLALAFCLGWIFIPAAIIKRTLLK